jgi:energy-coupling factor transporter ATP-binding protein EcfA2
MRITKIKIKDFGGIQDLPDIDLTKDGKNLLVFGENGSGKSSLFNSVRQFFRCSTSGLNIRDFQHRYIATPVPSISISILEDAETLNTYAWDSEGSTPDGVAQLLETAIMSPFFDYRILKGSHGPNESGGNLFELILNLILRSPNPNSGITFGDEFTEINVIHEELLHAQNWLEIDTPLTTDQIQDNDLYEAMQSRRTDLLSKFAEGIVAHLAQIKDRTNDLLSFFKNDLQITFRVVPGDYQTLVSVNFPEVHIDALLYGMAAPDHTSWLNEARLSSLALSIFLSNLLVQPKPQIKLLVLDDVLIGLDMGNRYPLLANYSLDSRLHMVRCSSNGSGRSTLGDL